MKKALVGAGFVLLSFNIPVKAMAAGFSKFYVLGDSLSDTGNLLNDTQELRGAENALPQPPDFGRVSSNDIWVDYVGDEIGSTPTLFTTPNPKSTHASSGLDNGLLPDAALLGVVGRVGLFTQPLIGNNQQLT